jgi:hypothetical protein
MGGSDAFFSDAVVEISALKTVLRVSTYVWVGDAATRF